MGTLVTYSRSERQIGETLARMEGKLREGGYQGYININSNVDDEGEQPLEFTCRFGNPGFSILQPLLPGGWAFLFRRILAHDRGVQQRNDPFPTRVGYC